MNPDERRRKIIDIMEQKKFVRVSFLTKSLFSSEATIRRDLSQLEKSGYIKRTNGGALYIKEDYHEFPFDYKATINQDKKKYIADLAIDFVSSFQSMFMDSSSTCSYLARKLVELNDITVLSNGFSSCQILRQNPRIKVYCPGGSITYDGGTIIGESATEFINTHTAQISFISGRGLDANFGISDIVEGEVNIKRAYRKRSDQMVLLLDSSKFQRSFFFQSLPLRDINTLISDAKPPLSIMDRLKEYNIECIY